MSLEENIGYEFKDKRLLEEAITHTSYAHEDSILEFISSKYLFKHFPKLNEGELTKARATVVCEDSLYEVAKKIDMPSYVKVSQGELNSNGNHNKAVLADTIEALIAAMYFDGGLEQSEKFIIENLKDAMDNATTHVGDKDFKSALQEKLQVNGEVMIEYNVISEMGPDHDKTFEVELSINSKPYTTGIEKSKKHAEMDAAKNMLQLLNDNKITIVI